MCVGNIDNTAANCVIWNYRVIPEVRYLADIGEYRTYAIEVTGSGFEHTIHDVSTLRGTALKMVRHFNRYQLEPEHFMDVVLDFIS